MIFQVRRKSEFIRRSGCPNHGHLHGAGGPSPTSKELHSLKSSPLINQVQIKYC